MLIEKCQAWVDLTDQQLNWGEGNQNLKSAVDGFGSKFRRSAVFGRPHIKT